MHAHKALQIAIIVYDRIYMTIIAYLQQKMKSVK